MTPLTARDQFDHNIQSHRTYLESSGRKYIIALHDSGDCDPVNCSICWRSEEAHRHIAAHELHECLVDCRCCESDRRVRKWPENWRVKCSKGHLFWALEEECSECERELQLQERP